MTGHGALNTNPPAVIPAPIESPGTKVPGFSLFDCIRCAYSDVRSFGIAETRIASEDYRRVLGAMAQHGDDWIERKRIIAVSY